MTTPSAILRPKTVLARTGLTRTALRTLVQRDAFPKPFKLAGTRAVGYCEGAVQAWIDRQKTAVV